MKRVHVLQPKDLQAWILCGLSSVGQVAAYLLGLQPANEQVSLQVGTYADIPETLEAV